MGCIVLGMAVFILDIMTKLVVELRLKPLGELPLLPNVFHLTYAENTGIAFGLFSGGRVFFILATLVVLVLLAVVYSKSTWRTRYLKIGTALLYGGALGNLIERMAKGYVVDFLDFRLIHFPIFNLADVAISVGAVLLMIHFILSER